MQPVGVANTRISTDYAQQSPRSVILINKRIYSIVNIAYTYILTSLSTTFLPAKDLASGGALY